MDPTRLPLRDVHLTASPSWWPPAPAWWLLLAVALAWARWRAWRAVRRRRWARWFDLSTSAGGPPERLAAASGLLRRAARRRQAGAERLQGEDWLRFLDGGAGDRFSNGPGRLLLEGGFRRRLDDGEFAAASALARARFLELMEGRR